MNLRMFPLTVECHGTRKPNPEGFAAAAKWAEETGDVALAKVLRSYAAEEKYWPGHFFVGPENRSMWGFITEAGGPYPFALPKELYSPIGGRMDMITYTSYQEALVMLLYAMADLERTK